MTDPQKIATTMINKYVFGTLPFKNKDGKGLDHTLWMLHGISYNYITGEKAHRWLGYAQAICVMHDIATLDELKELNSA